MNGKEDAARADEGRDAAARRPWIAPELRTMRAGSAEAGANPAFPEGMFATGTS